MTSWLSRHTAIVSRMSWLRLLRTDWRRGGSLKTVSNTRGEEREKCLHLLLVTINPSNLINRTTNTNQSCLQTWAPGEIQRLVSRASPDFVFHSWTTQQQVFCSDSFTPASDPPLGSGEGGGGQPGAADRDRKWRVTSAAEVTWSCSHQLTPSALITTNSLHIFVCVFIVCQHFFTRDICFSFFMCVSRVRSPPPPPTHSVTQWRILCCVHTAPGFRLYTGAQEEEEKLSLILQRRSRELRSSGGDFFGS